MGEEWGSLAPTLSAKAREYAGVPARRKINLAMLGESERRVAELAVTRFGVNSQRLQQTVKALLATQVQGQRLDLLDALTRDQLLTAGQADEIRLILGRTLVDPNSLKHNTAEDDTPKPDIFNATTLPPPADGDDTPRIDLSTTDLNRLGDYLIVRRLGEGGMGSVYLAHQESQNRQVAVKVLGGQHGGNQSAIDRFYREAKSGAMLKHHNIVRNLAVGQDQTTGLHYLVMEFVDGPSLDTLLEQEGKLSVGDAVHIILDVARGLEHVHSRNIVHRDIKPGNILITQSGLAKISDLGLAKRTDEASHLTAARQGFGTPYYMPYEQAINAKAADARSDIYALGATLYHLVVGEVPFTGASPVEIVEKKSIGEYIPASVANPSVPKSLDALLARMMAKEPRHRYQTVSALIVELERSQLSVAVPSFVDADRALHDPIVRQRLATDMQGTVMQMQVPEKPAPASKSWFLRYRDEHGHWHKAKLSTGQIINRQRAGKLPKSTEVSPYANGDFRPLRAYTEFQELIEAAAVPRRPKEMLAETADEERPTAIPGWWWLALGIGVGIVVVVGVLFLLLRSG